MESGARNENLPSSGTFTPAIIEDIRVKAELDSRCCGTLFRGKVSLPADAALGKAKVTLTYPAWKDGAVTAGAGDVEVADPSPSHARE